MKRFLTGLAAAGLLAGCTGQGDGATDQAGQATPGTTARESPAATGDATSSASAECNESFEGLAGMEIGSITELGDLSAEVEPTIESCESVAEWVAAADEVVADDVNPNTAALLLRMNCGSPSLSNTEICRELASS